jgi:hypothetical protein
MRLLFLTALLGGLCSAVQAAPPGYQPPRRFYTASHQAYRRLPTKFSLGINMAYYNGDLKTISLAEGIVLKTQMPC